MNIQYKYKQHFGSSRHLIIDPEEFWHSLDNFLTSTTFLMTPQLTEGQKILKSQGQKSLEIK